MCSNRNGVLNPDVFKDQMEVMDKWRGVMNDLQSEINGELVKSRDSSFSKKKETDGVEEKEQPFTLDDSPLSKMVENLKEGMLDKFTNTSPGDALKKKKVERNFDEFKQRLDSWAEELVHKGKENGFLSEDIDKLYCFSVYGSDFYYNEKGQLQFPTFGCECKAVFALVVGKHILKSTTRLPLKIG